MCSHLVLTPMGAAGVIASAKRKGLAIANSPQSADPAWAWLAMTCTVRQREAVIVAYLP